MTIRKAIERLLFVSEMIELRMSFRRAEETRVQEAFHLLMHGVSRVAKGAKQKQVYLEVLQNVLRLLGSPAAALCAAALGSTRVAGLKDRDRVELPHEMIKHEARFAGTVLKRLTQSIHVKYDLAEDEQDVHTDFVHSAVSQIDSTIEISDCPGPSSSVTGDVYELTEEDIETVLSSGEIAGRIFLTDTYMIDAKSFIMIPITGEMTNRLMINKPRVM